jgi:hypothetical protein
MRDTKLGLGRIKKRECQGNGVNLSERLAIIPDTYLSY